MTKAKAKTLAAELIERGYAPIVRELSPDTYTITVVAPLTSAQVSAIESVANVTANSKAVEFS